MLDAASRRDRKEQMKTALMQGSARARGLDEQLAAFGPAELGRLPAQDGVNH